jgi:hypothetical protein
MSTLNGMKYVVFNTRNGEKIVLFPASIEHAAFTRMVSKEWKAIRAGFVWFFETDVPDGENLKGQFQCYGESFSLGLQSDKEKDTGMLRSELVK